MSDNTCKNILKQKSVGLTEYYKIINKNIMQNIVKCFCDIKDTYLYKHCYDIYQRGM